MLPKSVVGSTVDTASKVDAPERPKFKNFKQAMVAKSGKPVTTSEIAKAAAGSSKRRKKNPVPNAEANIKAVGILPSTTLSLPVDVAADITLTSAEMETPRDTSGANTSDRTLVKRQGASQ